MSSSTTFKMPTCLSDITQTSRLGPITTYLTSLRNQHQLSVSSFCTIAKDNGTSLSSKLVPIHISIVPSNFPVRNVPSIDQTMGLQCLNASTLWPKAQNALPKTCLPFLVSLGKYSKCILGFTAFIASTLQEDAHTLVPYLQR
jgi:hypothetical protein